jgi:hypothetical protein
VDNVTVQAAFGVGSTGHDSNDNSSHPSHSHDNAGGSKVAAAATAAVSVDTLHTPLLLSSPSLMGLPPVDASSSNIGVLSRQSSMLHAPSAAAALASNRKYVIKMKTTEADIQSAVFEVKLDDDHDNDAQTNSSIPSSKKVTKQLGGANEANGSSVTAVASKSTITAPLTIQALTSTTDTTATTNVGPSTPILSSVGDASSPTSSTSPHYRTAARQLRRWEGHLGPLRSRSIAHINQSHAPLGTTVSLPPLSLHDQSDANSSNNNNGQSDSVDRKGTPNSNNGSDDLTINDEDDDTWLNLTYFPGLDDIDPDGPLPLFHNNNTNNLNTGIGGGGGGMITSEKLAHLEDELRYRDRTLRRMATLIVELQHSSRLLRDQLIDEQHQRISLSTQLAALQGSQASMGMGTAAGDAAPARSSVALGEIDALQHHQQGHAHAHAHDGGGGGGGQSSMVSSRSSLLTRVTSTIRGQVLSTAAMLPFDVVDIDRASLARRVARTPAPIDN